MRRILVGAGLPIRGARGGREAVDDSLTLDGATSARVKVRHGAGRLVAASVAGPGMLMQARFAGSVERDVALLGDSLEVTLHPPADEWTRWLLPWNRGSAAGLDWHMSFTGAVPPALEPETGASDTRLDLSMAVVALRVDQDRFPRCEGVYESLEFARAARRAEIQVEGGVGSVR